MRKRSFFQFQIQYVSHVSFRGIHCHSIIFAVIKSVFHRRTISQRINRHAQFYLIWWGACPNSSYGLIYLAYLCTQYGFFDSLRYDNRGLREFAWNRAWRPAKQPLSWFSDHWKSSRVELRFTVSGSGWVFHNDLLTIFSLFQAGIGCIYLIWAMRKSKTA